MAPPRWISPPSEPSRFDTGLTFTDILFGLVIAEIFMRLSNWGELPWINRWQLITATTLVLGSWIGFRRSRNRTRYELKFFNLPLGRFLLDQTMVLLYFRIATLTPTARPFHIDPMMLVKKTTLALLIIFGLYVFWDLGGIWMAKSPVSSKPRNPRYPKIDEDTNKKLLGMWSTVDWLGLPITFVAAVLTGALYATASDGSVDKHEAEVLFILAIVVLLGYRYAKEVRSSYKRPADGLPDVSVVDLTTVDPNAHAVGDVVGVVASGNESRWQRIN
jgi:hypothetical protein